MTPEERALHEQQQVNIIERQQAQDRVTINELASKDSKGVREFYECLQGNLKDHGG